MIEIIHQKISKEHLRKFLNDPYPEMIKFVVDINRGVIGLGGEFHADAEAQLLDDGSHQEDLWGANLYFDQKDNTRIEYTAMINIRPTHNNRSMQVEDDGIRTRMQEIAITLLP
jgi:hypothetical protein